MKISIVLGALLLAALVNLGVAEAAIKNAPFIPEVDQRFDQLERGVSFANGAITNPSLASGSVTNSVIAAGAVSESSVTGLSTDNLNLARKARIQYNFATNGGSSAAPISLGVTLPGNAIITRSYIYTDTQIAGTGSTVALSCGSANNIFSAASMTSITAGTITEGVSTGAASAFQKITPACAVTATIAVAPVTAGKFTIWLDYVTHD